MIQWLYNNDGEELLGQGKTSCCMA